MLLTLSQPKHVDLNTGGAHDFTSKLPQIRARLSPLPKSERSIATLQSGNRAHRAVPEYDMSNPHRGLPPASTMLPEPNRLAQTLSTSSPGQALGHMPAPPMQWQGQEDSMRNWLVAKAEEDKRKQEEEKTRQETLKLEQRRIEQSMLRESLSGGVPPHMVPMIYAGIGGAGVAQLSMDSLHHYASQLQMAAQQQQQQHHHIHPSSPEQAQRVIGQHPYQASAAGQQVSNTYSNEKVAPKAAPLQSYTTFAGPNSNAPTSAPRTIAQAQLPRLTTNDVFINQPNTNPSSARPLQQAQIAQDGPASSPSIYFHHWVPPAESKQPSTPATKTRREDEPTSAHPGSLASDSEYRDSPRKRKAQGGHQPNPPPTTAPQYGSPSFSTTSSASSKRVTDHQRNRSAAGLKDDQRLDSRKEEPHRLATQQPASIREGDERAESRSERHVGDTAAATAGSADIRAEHKQEQSRGGAVNIERQDHASSQPQRTTSSETR